MGSHLQGDYWHDLLSPAFLRGSVYIMIMFFFVCSVEIGGWVLGVVEDVAWIPRPPRYAEDLNDHLLTRALARVFYIYSLMRFVM